MKEDSANTQSRVLDAASDLFAEKGFRGTTVAAICRRAGANIAAVNYYFGSKKDLYREAWRHAHLSMLKVYPPDGAVPAGAPPAQRLRGRIRGMLQRAMADDGREFRIMNHEMVNPTGLLTEVLKDSLGPLRQAMRGILKDLLGARADERTVRWCELCVVGPCLHVVRGRHMAKALAPEPCGGFADLDAMVDHISSFVLAGIREIRRRMSAGNLPSVGRAAASAFSNTETKDEALD